MRDWPWLAAGVSAVAFAVGFALLFEPELRRLRLRRRAAKRMGYLR